MTERKAVHIPYAGALPNAAVVDERNCLHFTGGECVACVGACPFGVISLDGGDELVERTVGAVILATGSQLKLEPGTAYDLPNVMTTWEFERVINPDGPTGGEIRLRDGSVPKRIALVHCADACGAAPASSCSQTCCLALAKQALEAAHKLPDAEIVELAFDRQLGGPHYSHDAAVGDAPRQRARRAPRGRRRRHGRARRERQRDRHRESREQRPRLVLASSTSSSWLRRTSATPTRSALAGRMGVDVDELGLRADRQQAAQTVREPRRRHLRRGLGRRARRTSLPRVLRRQQPQARCSRRLVPGKKLVREAATAVVDDTVCGGCQVCVLACPYKAISFDGERKVATVNELLCQGCGTCASACPSSAITARHFTDDQILAEIHALTAKDHPALIS